MRKKEELIEQFGRNSYDNLAAAYRDAETAWKANAQKFLDAQNYLQAIADFGNTPVIVFVGGGPVNAFLANYCEVMHADDVRRYANLIGNISFKPVRPRENDYDRNYYLKELGNYDEMRLA